MTSQEETGVLNTGVKTSSHGKVFVRPCFSLVGAEDRAGSLVCSSAWVKGTWSSKRTWETELGRAGLFFP